ncbi:MAG: AzlC family ABC transporter permease [Firmicutes bacterium]|nr:AzlC family ABC transporter permease [Bacillota bacterium]
MNQVRSFSVGDNCSNSFELRQSVRDTIPVMLGVIPFGITCGIMGNTAGLTNFETILMSLLVFAGASQFVGISMIAAGITGWGIIVLTTLLVNLRHIIMGASLAPYMMKLPVSLQAILSFGLVDESYALTTNRINTSGYSASYQLGCSMTLYISWAISTTVGVVAGSYIDDPLQWGLDFAMPATFLVLLIPRLVDKQSLVVCGIAAVTAVLGSMYLPGKWYIIIACLLASAIGGMMEREGANNHAE